MLTICSSPCRDSFHNTVDGQPRSSKNKHRGINPATGEELWEVPIGNQQDVDDAVVSAQKAFETWSQTPLEKRKETLSKFRDHYMSYADEMVDLLCAETGKPVSEQPQLYRLLQSLLTISNPAPICRVRGQGCIDVLRPPSCSRDPRGARRG
jgi:hypothetical protein